MSESYSKRRKTGDERTQQIQSQSSEENSDRAGDVAAESSEDSISLPAMILSPVSSVEIPSIVDFPLIQNMEILTLEKSCTDCDEIIRRLQKITKNKHLVKNLTETEIRYIYEKICLLWENLSSEHQEEEPEIPSTSAQASASISDSTSKFLRMIRNEIQALRLLGQSSEEPCRSSCSTSIPIEERSKHSITLSRRKESTQATSSSELQKFIDSPYSLELVLRLIRYNREQMGRNTSNMSSGTSSSQSAKDSKETLHIELLKELRICMLEEVETIKTCIDYFKKSECTSDNRDTTSDSEAADMESEDNSVATEIQIISASSSSEVKEDNSFNTKMKVLSTSAKEEKVPEKIDTIKETIAPAHVEIKEMVPLSLQEMTDPPSAEAVLRSDQIPLLGDESKTVSRQQRYPELTLCFKSSKTDVDDGERSTGPCVTEETLLSTPDEDTGKSISSIPWDTASFHSSIPDEQLDSETEETEL